MEGFVITFSNKLIFEIWIICQIFIDLGHDSHDLHSPEYKMDLHAFDKVIV